MTTLMTYYEATSKISLAYIFLVQILNVGLANAEAEIID